jgi:hypothetical protein
MSSPWGFDNSLREIATVSCKFGGTWVHILRVAKVRAIVEQVGRNCKQRPLDRCEERAKHDGVP